MMIWKNHSYTHTQPRAHKFDFSSFVNGMNVDNSTLAISLQITAFRLYYHWDRRRYPVAKKKHFASLYFVSSRSIPLNIANTPKCLIRGTVYDIPPNIVQHTLVCLILTSILLSSVSGTVLYYVDAVVVMSLVSHIPKSQNSPRPNVPTTRVT